MDGGSGSVVYLGQPLGSLLLHFGNSEHGARYSLNDRVAVMTHRPGTIKRDVHIAMPRLRDSASAEFNALKKELAKLVMEQQMRYTQTEIQGYTAD